MLTHKKWPVFSIVMVMMLTLVAFATPARGVVLNGTPGGFISLPWGTLIDSATGGEYGLVLIAREANDTTNIGQVTVQLLGPSVSVCSTHGSSVDIGPTTDGENFSGNFPLEDIQCGTAYNMAVSIEGCTAKTEMHGFSHTDYPLIIYSGPNTIELTLKKTSSDSGKVNIKIYTPMGPIKLNGNISGSIQMDTCP